MIMEAYVRFSAASFGSEKQILRVFEHWDGKIDEHQTATLMPRLGHQHYLHLHVVTNHAGWGQY